MDKQTKRPIRFLLEALVVLGLAGLLGGAGWLAWGEPAPGVGGSGLVLFEVEKGQSVRSVAEVLKTRGSGPENRSAPGLVQSVL
ncbi:MAG: hypothetical protein MZU79_01390 [Anaerotruncus sp.]|nr:hypothetical protein [Anaerotruncus sp.]